MATIVDSVNGTTLQAAFDAANLSINNLWSSTADAYLSAFFAETPSIVVVGQTHIVLRSGVPGESDCYLIINGSGMGYSLASGFTGSVTDATLYQNVTATSGSGASLTVTGETVVKATLTSSQFTLNTYPAGTTTVTANTPTSQSVVITGSLPTSTSTLSQLLGYDINSGAELTRSGSFSLTGLTVTDSLGDKIEWTSTGIVITVPAAATGPGGHGYKLTLAGVNGISLTAAQITALGNGSSTFDQVFTQPLTSVTFTDTTDNATLASITGISGLTLGKALTALENNALPSVFSASDTFDASGAGTGVEFNFGRPIDNNSGQIVLGQITGSAFNDTLTGSTGSDTIIGGAGNDVLAAQSDNGRTLTTWKLWSDGGIRNANSIRTTDDGKYMFMLTQDSRFTDGATLNSNTTSSAYATNTWGLYRVDTTSGAVVKVNTNAPDGWGGAWDVSADGKAVVYHDSVTGSLVLKILGNTGVTSTKTVVSSSGYSGGRIGIATYNGDYEVYYSQNGSVLRYTYDTATGIGSAAVFFQPGMTYGVSANDPVVSADGSKIAFLGWDSGTSTYCVTILDHAGSLPPQSVVTIGSSYSGLLSVSNDGQYVLTRDSAIHIYSVATGTDLLAGQPWASNVFSDNMQLVTDAHNQTYVVFNGSVSGGSPQAYRYNVTTQSLELLSATANGTVSGNTWMSAASDNGQYVVMFGWNDATDSIAISKYDSSAAAPGASSTDKLVGGAGNDTLIGGNGTSMLIGGAGSDTLIGGAGADRFLYLAPTDGADVIQNFTTGTDKIVLSWNSGLSGAPTIYSSYGVGDAANPSSPFLYLSGNTLYYVPASHPGGSSDAVALATTTGVTLTTGDVIAGQSAASSGATINLDTLAQSGVLNSVTTSTASGTNFTGSAASLTNSATVTGNAGVDTLTLSDSTINVSAMTLSSVEVLKTTNTTGVTFTVAAGQLAGAGSINSIAGNTGTDTLVTSGSTLDLGATTLSSIEVLKAGTTTGTTFTVDVADLATNGSVIGNSGTDTLVVKSATVNLTTTTLSGVEVLATNATTATTYTVDQADLASGGSVIGTTATDTLVVNNAAITLTATTLSSVEVIKAGLTTATVFTVDQADLATNGTVVGSAGVDTLVTAEGTLSLGGTTLTGVEVLKAGTTADTTFAVNQADLASGGSIVGNTGKDTLVALDTSLNLNATSLSGVEVLRVGTTTATTITVDQADLATGGSVIGNAGIDTLAANGTSLSLIETTLSGIEVIKAGSTTATTFTVDQADLATNGSVVGNSGVDTLVTNGNTLDLSAVTVSGVEVLKAGTTADTTFTVDANDLMSGGSVVGNSGTDTLVVNAAAVTLTSTTLTGVEVIQAGTTSATTFTVDANDLAADGSVIGTAASDTLVVNNAAIDLKRTTLSGIEVIKAGVATATITLDQSDLMAGGSVIGTTGTDTLVTNSATLDLSATTVSSIEVLKAGTIGATTFTVDSADLVASGSVVGNSGTDTLVVNAAAVTLTATTLSSVEVIAAGTTADTTFTVDVADLAANGSVIGNTGTDTLVVNSAAIDLRTTALSGVEVLKAGTAGATVFTVNQADLASGGSVIGTSAGVDTLIAADTTLDLSATTLSSVEVLKANSTSATTFTVDQSDLNNSARTIIGNTGIDTLAAAAGQGSLDLTGVTLSGVEVLKINNTTGATLVVDQSDLAAGGSVIGNVGSDTLSVNSTAIDLTNVTLSSIDVIKAGINSATTFTVDQADLMSGGSVVGSDGQDTLVVRDANIDLSGTSLTSVEVLKAGSTSATTFTLGADDLFTGGSIVGTAGIDTIVSSDAVLNLTSTTTSGIEVLKVGTTAGTSILIRNLAANATIIGNTGADTLVVNVPGVDMSNAVITGIEEVNAAAATGTLVLAGGAGAQTMTGNGAATYIFTALADAGDTITNFHGTDKLLVAGTEWGLVAGDPWTAGAGHAYLRLSGSDLIHVSATGVETTIATTTGHTLTMADVGVRSVERTANTATYSITGEVNPVDVLKAVNATTATTFIANATNLSAYASIIGSNGIDTLQMNSTAADFSHMTLSSLDVLKAGSTSATTFTVSQDNLTSLRSVTGNTGVDVLVTASATLDLSGTALSSIEVLKAGTTDATTFTVDQADLATGGSIVGNTGQDTLVANGTSLSLTGTTLSGIEVIKAGVSGTSFAVDQADLAAGGTVVGSAGSDTLTVTEANIDLAATILSGIEVIKTAATGAGTILVDQADLLSGGSVIGNAASNTLAIAGTSLDLTSTTLSSIEVLKANNTAATTFTIDQTDLVSGGSVIGNAGSDTLAVASAAVDLSNTTLSGIEVVRAGTGTNTTVKLATATGIDTLAGGVGTDTVIAAGATLNLASTELSSIEVLKAGTAAATTFTVGQANLTVLQSVVGSAGADTIVVTDTLADLSGTTFSGVEVIKAGASTATTLTIAQANLASGGSVIGTASAGDTLVVAGTGLDLLSTTLSGIEVLKAGTGSGTTFTLDQNELNGLTAIVGTGASDTLVLSGSAVNLGSTTLSGIEVIKQLNGAAASTLTLTQAALMAGGTVIGSAGTDTLVVGGTSIDLSATTLSSIDVLKASGTTATTFTVAQSTLGGTSTVIGSAGTDTLVVASSSVDLTSTTLSSIEVIKAGTRAATTFLVNQGALATNGSVIGTAAIDTLVSAGTSLDLRQTTLSGVEVIKAGTGSATTFTVDQADLAAGGKIIGARGVDTLVAAGTSLDLRQTTLSSIEVLKAGATAATTFTVDQNDLIANGSVIGNTGTDTLVLNGTAINLGGTTLSSIEVLKAGATGDTVFTMSQASLTGVGSLIGTGGNDTVVSSGASLNLSNTTLSSIEVLKAGLTTDTSLTVAQATLKAGGSVIGSAGTDTLVTTGASLDLTATTVSGVEVIKAGGTAPTTFTVNQADFTATGAAVVGTAGIDTLVVADAGIDLRAVTLSSVEVIKAGGGASTFTLSQANLAANGTVIGTSGRDSVVVADAALDLSGTTLSGIEVLSISKADGAALTVKQANLTGTTLSGGAGSDTLVINDAALDLSSIGVTSIEVLKAGKTTATSFTVKAGDIATLTSVVGNAGLDTLTVTGATVDLSGTTLSSIEVVKSSATTAQTFTIGTSSLSAGSTVLGGAGVDVLQTSTDRLDLSAVTVSSIETLKASTTAATTFVVDQADLAAGGSVIGNAGIDTLTANGATLNLTATTLSSVEVLKAGTTTATTFTLDTADLNAVNSVVGNSGIDTLVVNSASIDLTTTELSGVEVIKAGLTAATTFTVNQADLAVGGTVVGSAGNDTLVMAESVAGLAGTTLSSIETVTANGVTYGVRTDLTDGGLASNVIVAGTGASDTLRVTGSGNVALLGGAGNDTYAIGNSRFNSVLIGDGAGSNDRIDLSGLPLDVEFAQHQIGGDDLILTLSGGKTITVAGQFGGTTVEVLSDRYQDYVLSNAAQASGVNQIMVGANGVNNVFVAGDGNDMLFGGVLNDTLTGGDGNDLLDGSAGDNTLNGGAGDDVLTTVHADGANLLVGGAGDDTYVLGGLSANTVSIDGTGGGADTYVLKDVFGTVTVSNAVRVEGGVLDLSGQLSTDVTNFSRSGSDLVLSFDDAGGSSFTVAGQYNGTNGLAAVNNHGVTQVLTQVADNRASVDSVLYVAGSGGETDIKGSVAGNDILVGGAGADTIVGSAAGASTLIGGAGIDTITASGSGDTVAGGAGADVLTAGSDVTVFWYNTASEGGDTINGFTSGTDKIAVYSPNFGSLGVGTLANANLVNGTQASSSAAAQFLFDSSTHELRYHAAGDAVGTSTLIATLNGVSSVNNGDIIVVNKVLGA